MSGKLVLASGSPIRAELLRKSGVPFTVDVARVDEAALKAAMLSEDAAPRDIADALAEMKARKIAGRSPDSLVLGADQVLVCKGQLYDKAADMPELKAQLRTLSGQTHELLSAAVIYENAEPVWRHIGRARMVMRLLSDAFIDAYTDAGGDDLLATVGGYKLEDGGAQLFTRVDGDYFSVLGMPLLEVLGFLRTRGVLLG